jgi:adenylate cyclase class IV
MKTNHEVSEPFEKACNIFNAMGCSQVLHIRKSKSYYKNQAGKIQN